MILRQKIFFIIFYNPKACGVQRHSPGGGCGGTKPPAHKIKLEIFFFQQYFYSKNCLGNFFLRKKFSKSSEMYAQNFGPVTIMDMRICISPSLKSGQTLKTS